MDQEHVLLIGPTLINRVLQLITEGIIKREIRCAIRHRTYERVDSASEEIYSREYLFLIDIEQ